MRRDEMIMAGLQRRGQQTHVREYERRSLQKEIDQLNEKMALEGYLFHCRTNCQTRPALIS